MATVVFGFIFLFAVAFNAARVSGKGLGVVGGYTISITHYPYQVLVQRYGKPHCGGSIISEQYILTAAHCVEGYDIDAMEVRVGSSDVDKGGAVYEVEEGFVHDKYNPKIYDYDVAVLKVANKMKINNRTSKIVKLADSESSLTPGEYVKVSGWGKTGEFGPYSTVLKAVELPVIPPETCESAFEGTNSQFTSHMFCAGFHEGGSDSCVGDSGGPAVQEETSVQYGIVSWGRGCARAKYPGVYTAIPTVRDWIKKVTGI